MENLQYKRAVILAKSLTEYFNKYHYTYSGAGWESHVIFRDKHLLDYGIYPEVTKSKDGNIVITAEIKLEV